MLQTTCRKRRKLLLLMNWKNSIKIRGMAMRKITFMIRRNPNTIVLYWAMQTGILVSFALLGVFSGLPSWIATVSFTLLSLDLCMFFSNPKFFEFYQKLPRRSSNSPSDLFSAENSQDITSVTDRFVPHYRPILCLVAFMAFMQWMGYNFLYAEF